MYLVDSFGTLLKSYKNKSNAQARIRDSVSRNVLLLGVVSMLTDISSEMVSAILPLYLVVTVGLSPLQFGAIDGLYQGAAAIVRLASGVVSDRWKRYKEVAAFGYGLSAVCKLGLLAAGGSAVAIAGVVVVDRTGKGLRTSPRDALISLSSTPATYGISFGIHRSLDTLGAMLGPLLAFGLLLLTPGKYDVIFVVSFCFAVLGVVVLGLFVENRKPVLEEHEKTQLVTLRNCAGLLRHRRFRWLTISATLLSLATISDAFIYLGLQRRFTFDVRLLPLLYVGTALVYMLLAAPFGRVADRIGRLPVFIGGYVVLIAVYTSLFLPINGGAYLVFAYLALLGAYYAATDGVLMAIASGFVEPELRASGLAIVTTGTSVAKLFASLIFGALWTWQGLTTATLIFGGALIVALLVTSTTLRPTTPAELETT